MNRKEYNMTCASEECNEIAQRISKALRFGLTEVQPGQPLNNAERIIDEFHDLFAVMTMLVQDGHLPARLIPSTERIVEKWKKIDKFTEISRREGTLE